MAFDDFHIKPVLTSLAFTLVYDWFDVHVASIADVREVINLLTLSPTRTDAAAQCPFPLSFPLSAASILKSLGGAKYKGTIIHSKVIIGALLLCNL